MDKVRVFAPATVANVGPAFDILGFAVNAPGDEVELSKISSASSAIVSEIIGDNGRLPLDPQKNTAAVAVNALLAKLDLKTGISIKLKKNMPLGSGLGSSAASAVAALFAANELLDRPYSIEELLPFAMEAERVACGAAHADNVAPCLFGGFVLIKSYEPLDVIKLPTPDNLFCSLVHPDIEIRTADSRRVLRPNVSLQIAVKQAGNVAGLITALFKNDLALLGRSLDDQIIEPERSVLIPGFSQVKAAAITAGALGCSISGSGPSIFALSAGESCAHKVAEAMRSEFETLGFQATSFVSEINQTGPKLL